MKTLLRKLLKEIEHGKYTLHGKPAAMRQNPAVKAKADSAQTKPLSDQARKHVAGLMRVNHAGEIAAQALYRGQALVARDEKTKEHLYEAAQEEIDHLAWCEDRLTALNDRTSILGPVWYTGAFAIGAAAGLISDKLSLGFIHETETQVMRHLQSHLDELPEQDIESRRIIEQMYTDEKKHAEDAIEAGGSPLPKPIQKLMTLTSKVMTTAAYRL